MLRTSAPDYSHITELLGYLGMTKDEAVAYLCARGFQTSLGAVKAWARNHYSPPVEALRELIVLASILELENEFEEIPAEAPASFRRRHQALTDIRIWMDEVEPGRLRGIE